MIVTTLLVAAASAATPHAKESPGSGSRMIAELGVARFSGSYVRSAPDATQLVGVQGPAINARYAYGTSIRPGFVLLGSFSFFQAFVRENGPASRGIDGAVGYRIGPEIDWYPSARIGFHVRVGFGLASITLRGPDERLLGTSYTAAIARDTYVGKNVRIGATLRLDVESVRARDGEVRSGMNTLTPSLAFELLAY